MEFICRQPPWTHRIYMTRRLLCVQRNMPAACGGIVADPGEHPMLDVVYILIGAAFLGGCVLYAFACDHL